MCREDGMLTDYLVVHDKILTSAVVFRATYRATPLQEEERLFIEAIRTLNYQASRLQAEESQDVCETENGAAPREQPSTGDSDRGRPESPAAAVAAAVRRQPVAAASAAAAPAPNLYNKTARLFPATNVDAQDASDDVDSRLDEATAEVAAAAFRVSRQHQFDYPGDGAGTSFRTWPFPGGNEGDGDEIPTLEPAASSISGMMELQSLVAASTSKRPSVDAAARADDADGRMKRTRT